MKRILKWILGLVIFSLLTLWGLGIYVFESQGTDTAFQASDGNWADNEVLFKGRSFESIVFSYELYKIVCGIPEVQLQRITEKPSIFTTSWWFDDFDSPKWRVPIAKRHPNLEGESYYRPKDKEHCSNQPVSKEHLEQAEEQTIEYINEL
jgi:hypothetical protein